MARSFATILRGSLPQLRCTAIALVLLYDKLIFGVKSRDKLVLKSAFNRHRWDEIVPKTGTDTIDAIHIGCFQKWLGEIILLTDVKCVDFRPIMPDLPKKAVIDSSSIIISSSTLFYI